MYYKGSLSICQSEILPNSDYASYTTISHTQKEVREIFLDLYIIYVYNISMNKKNQYPDWVEKYRSKGRTIRKVRGGYGLYECTSEYVPGAPYPKLKQTYLGMITQEDGFIPKKRTLSHPSYIEFGLSHFIWCNFKRPLIRSSFSGDEAVVRLGIIMYIFGSIKPCMIRSTFLSDGIEDMLIERAAIIAPSRIKTITNKIDSLMNKSLGTGDDRTILESQLRLCVMESNNRRSQIPALPEEAAEIIERNGLKYAANKERSKE